MGVWVFLTKKKHREGCFSFVSILNKLLPRKPYQLQALPQQTHVSETDSCSNGIQREVAPVSFFDSFSQASSPHHMALINRFSSERMCLMSSNGVELLMFFHVIDAFAL